MTMPADERLSPSKVLSHLGVMALGAALLGLVAAGLALPIAGALGIGARDVARTVEDLPLTLKTEDLAQKTFIVDNKGRTIATVYDENRINVPLRQISRTMVQAIVAIEDYRFYQHGAMDVKGTLRALIKNQVSGGNVQGGSSITQQLVKLTLVNQAKGKAERAAATADTYARKLRELQYAITLEREHSKDWILEHYLNIAYFGDQAYGVQAAAQHYFDVNAKDLNLRQAALLAGLVRSPTAYDPTRHPDAAIQRRNVVIARMAELGAISQAEADKTMKQSLGLDVQEASSGCVESTAQFFCDYVVNYLKQDPDLGATQKQREQLLYSGGLTVKTTLDMRYQKAAQDSVRGHVRATDEAVGGLAMVEPGTGRVKALAQSRPMGKDRKRGETFLNYTVPKELGGANGFQPGSTFKAFVLAAALEQGVPLDYGIEAPHEIVAPEAEYVSCKNRTYGYGEWPVKNATSDGPMTLVTGTRLSVNTFYAQLEMATGLCEPFRLAKAMGVRLTQPNGVNGIGIERAPTFTLGAPNASPLEMAEAYATFAAHGKHCDATPIAAIYDADGKLVKKYAPQCTQVLQAGVADAVNYVLRGVQEPGGFGYIHGLALSVPSAGKTGTTTDDKAVWFVGYTPQLATAAMIAGANKDGEPQTLDGHYVGGQYIYIASGSAVAGPMWKGAMGVINRWLKPIQFRSFSLAGIAPHPYATVPSVSGMSIASATSVLHSAGFKVAVAKAPVASQYGAGLVAHSYPAGGASALAGGPVLLVPSSGAPVKPPHGHGHGHGPPTNGNPGGGWGGWGGGH